MRANLARAFVDVGFGVTVQRLVIPVSTTCNPGLHNPCKVGPSPTKSSKASLECLGLHFKHPSLLHDSPGTSYNNILQLPSHTCMTSSPPPSHRHLATSAAAANPQCSNL